MAIKKVISASILALSLGSVSQADEIIHVTGSTAFRSAFVTSVERLMGGAGNFKAAYLPAGSSPTEKNANYSIFQGSISGVAVTIKCTWTGSTGGFIANVKQVDIRNVPTNGWMSIANLPATNTIVQVASPSYALDGEPQGQAPDVNMGDSSQAATGYVSPVLGTPNLSGAHNVTAPGQCGVIVFDWVANNGTPASVANLTTQQAQNILAGGVYLSTLTGNPADSTTAAGPVVYAAGRNFDSGTRLSQFAETGFGVFTAPQQVEVKTTGSGSSRTVTNISLYPAENLFVGTPYQLNFDFGQSGYASGGTLATQLQVPGTVGKSATSEASKPLYESALSIAGGYVIAYLGRSDATTALSTTDFPSSTAHKLTYNGVADTDTNVREGLYQCWEYEYMYKTSRTTNPLNLNQNNVINALYNGIVTTDASVSGVLIDTMNVGKTIEGGLITHL